ncbi:Uncharacterised protein [Bordetella pertussis]|nr:Uncharacterised protein [Bordetella pertussis]CFO07261.1 Uncharacterised protein [Bordetella pertussis]CFT95922.1 Uncharacterised protein [Bordetella pertussis]CFU66890.1 Uncharacterised protein [Bordetella pertussis]CFW28642.1 Uncharacterised protein [Bordetella pertussis]
MRRARPSSSEPTQPSGSSTACSMAASMSSGSFMPWAEKNLMPLSWYGLCEALITIPAARRSVRVR